jgi:hypothetical protein
MTGELIWIRSDVNGPSNVVLLPRERSASKVAILLRKMSERLALAR